MESGLLREGDIILSVNSEPLKDLSYQVSAFFHPFSSCCFFCPYWPYVDNKIIIMKFFFFDFYVFFFPSN